jgi:4-aminobutyrate aminotransferase-like enzyme
MPLLKTLQLRPPPHVALTRGEGCFLYDDAGNRYLDLLSGTWCCALGHSHPRLVAVLQEQLKRLVHLNAAFSSREIESATEQLTGLMPRSLNRVTWVNTGSEAVELALKLARIASGGDGAVVWGRGYYGATNLASSLSQGGGSSWCQPITWRVPAPHCSECPVDSAYPGCDFRCLDLALTDVRQAAAVLYEPVLAVGGVIVPPEGYGRRVQEWARRLDALFILEEVTTGMGRTGRWFGFEHENLEPDVLVLGKVLGNGLPVAAVVTTEEVEQRCEGRLRHVQSHQNDPWSGAVAATVIQILKEEGLVQRSADLGRQLLGWLEELEHRWPVVAEARGLGLVAALEFADACQGEQLRGYLFKQGIIVDYQEASRCLRFFPPYVLEEQDLARAVELIEQGIRSLA